MYGSTRSKRKRTEPSYGKTGRFFYAFVDNLLDAGPAQDLAFHLRRRILRCILKDWVKSGKDPSGSPLTFSASNSILNLLTPWCHAGATGSEHQHDSAIVMIATPTCRGRAVLQTALIFERHEGFSLLEEWSKSLQFDNSAVCSSLRPPTPWMGVSVASDLDLLLPSAKPPNPEPHNFRLTPPQPLQWH